MNHSSKKLVLFVCSLYACMAAFAQTALQQTVAEIVPELVGDYKVLHRQPELSGYEEQTSVFISGKLKALGYEVTDHVGKYDNKPWKGYGVVGILKNGNGKTVLVRTDMDALPIQEKTGLDYASQVFVLNDAGARVPVMHACGHDIHMAVFLGVAKVMMETKSRWSGTVIMVAQPAEEGGPGGSGAEALLRDGLYARFPRPDFVLGLHQVPNLAAGRVGLMPGYSNAISGGGEIIVHGVAAHPARPQDGKDPIVLAAQIILALQTIVSRELNPLEPATLTVGAIHGGMAENSIPDAVSMKLSFRALNPVVFGNMLSSINRIVKSLAIAAGLPEEKMPEVLVKQGYTANYNDPVLTARIKQVFEQALGASRVQDMQPVLTGEDFSYYGMDKKIPGLFFNIGSMDAVKLNERISTGMPIPTNHSPFLTPLPDQTIETGVIAMVSAVLELLKPATAGNGHTQ